MTRPDFELRPATADDEAFILSLAPRFVDFPLPEWRQHDACLKGVEADLRQHASDPPDSSALFIAEDGAGRPLAFLHLQTLEDFFTGRLNCHISDVATRPGAEGRGLGRTLLEYSQQWAADQGCDLITLSVFPGNRRAIALYRKLGFDTDMLRLAKPVKDAKGP